MNKKLQVSDKDLPRVLGEVLQPEMNRHTIATNQHGRGNCTKCGRNLDWSQWHKPCGADSPADPIPIDDWNVAIKWRDWAVEEFNECEFESALKWVYNWLFLNKIYSEYDFYKWVINKAKPKHWLFAAAQCKLESENNNGK